MPDHFSLFFLCHLCHFSCVASVFFTVSPVSFYFLRNNSLERKFFWLAIHGWQKNLQGVGLLSFGFRSGLLLLRLRPGFTPFRVSGFTFYFARQMRSYPPEDIRVGRECLMTRDVILPNRLS